MASSLDCSLRIDSKYRSSLASSAASSPAAAARRAATRSVDLSRRWLKRSRSKSPGSRAATGFAAAANASSAGSTRPASRSWNAPARSSSTLAPVDKSYTSLSTTASSTPAPARSTTRANSREQLGEEGAAKHRDLGIRVALQRVDRERQAQGFAVPEKRAFGLGQAQLGMIRAECGLLHTSELAVALEQRPDARVGERIAVTDRLRRRKSRLAPRLGLRLGLGALGHSASASMSARNRGRRSTCATSAIARPELLTPLSLTSSPYLGWLPAGWCVVTPPMRSIDLSASSTSVTWTPSRWRLASQPAARTRWLVP